MDDRLISLNEAKKVLSESYKGTEHEIIGKAFAEMLDRVPTACDPKKIINQIDNLGIFDRCTDHERNLIIHIIYEGCKYETD